MRTPKRSILWIVMALPCLLPACGLGSDDTEPTEAAATSRAESGTPTVSTIPTPDVIILSGHTGAVPFVAWSPDGTLLATAADGFSAGDVTPRLWDAAGTLVAELVDQPVAITGLSWSADSGWLAGAGADGIVQIWNRDGTASSTITVSDDDSPAPVAAVAWSPDGSLLATAVVRQPDPATPGPQNTLPGTVQLWESDGSELRSFEIAHTFRGSIRLAWSGDGSRLAAGGNDLHVWDTSGTELLAVAGGEFDIVPAMALSADGNLLAHIDMTGRLHVTPVEGGAPSSAPGFGGATSLAFSPDSAQLAVATETILLVVPADNPVSVPTRVVENGVQGNPAWSSDSQRLAIGQARRAVQVAAPDGSALAVLTGCDGFVTTLAWQPDGVMLAAGLNDGRVCLWDVPTL